ncbi:MAG: hypothetical protein IPK65_05035 [Gammaproteobacteria bacterium]|nr:hypothetical protein [Gammaproteobacteria bacterium]
MTSRRVHLLFAGLLPLCAASTAAAQDMNDVAEDRDIAFIEQCLQRAAEERISEDRVDAFIDRCIDEFYAERTRNDGADNAPHDAGIQDGTDAAANPPSD